MWNSFRDGRSSAQQLRQARRPGISATILADFLVLIPSAIASIRDLVQARTMLAEV